MFVGAAGPVRAANSAKGGSWGAAHTGTHTHTTQFGYLDVSPGVGLRHLEGPKNPDGLNLRIHIFVYVYKVHMCIHMLRGGMRSWTNCFFSFNLSFLLRKVEDVTTISKPQSLTW